MRVPKLVCEVPYASCGSGQAWSGQLGLVKTGRCAGTVTSSVDWFVL
jgi:hypothetical protein